jgi:D-alanyl-D-alanine carboxypeptidase
LVGGATMGLAVGDVVTVTDLLWGLLLPSGNDAATALARHVGGSVDNFVAAMNARAEVLGLSQTHFVNAHGLDAQGHVSSAADLLTLTRELWGYPLFRSMVGTARVQWNGRDLSSTNEWLTTFDGATGVKTGTTDEAGECLVASVERDGRTVLLVIMGSQARYEDATKLYDAFRTAYAWDTANGRELSIINRVYDEDGRVWFMHPTGAAPIVLQHQPGVPEVRSFRRLAMPGGDLLAGTQVGVLEWWAGAELIGAQALVVR